MLSLLPPNGRGKQRASRTRTAVDPSGRRGVAVRIGVANQLEGFPRIANREGLEAHVSSVRRWQSSVDACKYCTALEMNLCNIAHRRVLAHSRFCLLAPLAGLGARYSGAGGPAVYSMGSPIRACCERHREKSTPGNSRLSGGREGAASY